jgi:tetratricopeptide (TPR) repeat protein
MTSPNRDLQPVTVLNQATATGVLAAADFSPGTIVANRFKIERLLGMGGMGLVYLARDTELNIDVALKLLRPELASRRDAFERFRQELLLARQVSSPHVVRIHDLVKHNEAWLISMDFVPGQSLDRVLDEKGALPVEQAIAMTRQLALGLAAAHARGVVHRDLKPANVLVNEQGDACITDFGVARSAGNTGITDSGVIIGTPAYLSPEQARAEPLDGRSDLYALGLILFEMLTGTLPFRGGTPAEMMVQRIVRDPPSAATIKPELPNFAVRLCAHLLELKPAHRFQSAEEVVRAIDARRVTGLMRSSRRRLTWILACTLLLTLSGLGLIQWRAATTPERTAAAGVAVLAPDLAVLPLLVDSPDGADLGLGLGIGRLLADQLVGQENLHSADPLQVQRALAELGYDPAAAQRQLERVFDVIEARQLLLGTLVRDAKGLRLTLSLWRQGEAAAHWMQSTPDLTDSALPDALMALQRSLMAALGLDSNGPRWPEAGTLRELGELQQAPPTPEGLDAALRRADASASPALWWSLLHSLDSAGRVAEATAVARRARDALNDDTAVAARSASAFARVLLGETETAIAELEALVATSRFNHPLRVLLARARADSGNHDLAISLLQQVVAEDQRNVDAWYALGKYAMQSGDAKRAVDDYLVRAQVLANRLNDVRMQANVANVLGIGYRRLGQLDAAAERLEYARQLRETLGDRRGQANSLSNLATVRSIQGDFDAAEAAITQARTIIEPLGDHVTLAILLNEAGILAEERGYYRDALTAYRDALRLRQTQGDMRLIGESQINVGFAYYQLGEFDNAQTYWQQATATYDSIDDRYGMVHARESLGLAKIARGDWAEARLSLESSLAEAESLQMAEERTISLSHLAELDRLEGRMQSALTRAMDAQRAFEKREDLRGVVEMKLLLSAIRRDLGDWQGAALALQGVDATSTNGEQASQYAWRQGEIALGQDDPTAALKAADLALERAAQAHSYSSELTARLLRARALAALKRPNDALAELKRVEDGVARYASVPLRLLLAETSLQVNGASADSVYRETRALLARLPSYGRAFQLHARAATSLRSGNTDAITAADRALKDLIDATAESEQPTLFTLAHSLGVEAPSP